MNVLRNLVYSKQNIRMLESLCVKKINEITGVPFKNDSFFKKNFDAIFEILSREQLEIFEKSDLPIRSCLIKINNVIISEITRFIVNNIPKSTKLSDLDEDEEEPEFEELEYEITDKLSVLDKESQTYSVELYLKNVQYIELLSVSVDKSDYCITEYCNSFSIKGIKIEIPAGNYKEEDLEKIIQDNIKEKISDKIEIVFRKIFDNYVFLFTEEGEITLDFTVKNSIANILGFEEKIYNLKFNEEVRGSKHNLGLCRKINMYIEFHKNIKDNISIYMNVPYNSTKFYEPIIVKKYKTDDFFDVENIIVKFTNENGTPYNFRKRPFSIIFKTVSLLI